jgi:hypothetical protein
MGILLDPVNVFNFPNLFTLLWVTALVVVAGAIVVYSLAGRRYRRYPVLLSLHEWIFWPIIVTWGLVPLLVVIQVPLLLILLVIVPGTAVAIWARFVKFPPLIAAANAELRRRRYVPPGRGDGRGRPRPTPAGARSTGEETLPRVARVQQLLQTRSRDARHPRHRTPSIGDRDVLTAGGRHGGTRTGTTSARVRLFPVASRSVTPPRNAPRFQSTDDG